MAGQDIGQMLMQLLGQRGAPAATGARPGETMQDPRIQAMQQMGPGGGAPDPYRGTPGAPEYASPRDRQLAQDRPTDGMLETFVNRFGQGALPPMSSDQMDPRDPGYTPTPRPRPEEAGGPPADEQMLDQVHQWMDRGNKPPPGKKKPAQSNDGDADDEEK